MDVRYERLKDGSIYLDRPIGQPSLGSYGTRLIPWPLGRIDVNHAKALNDYLAED